MPKARNDAMAAVKRASDDLHEAVGHFVKLAADRDERISYSAHALNNYLMVVSTTIKLLEKKLGTIADADTKMLLANLKHASNTMLSTVGGVITTAAVSSRIPPLIFAEVSFAQLIDVACEAYVEPALAKGISLGWNPRRRAAEATADLVFTDRVAAGAVLDNLISNAVKFTPGGEAVSITVSKAADCFVCSVWDRGPGLSDEDLSKLFQRGVPLSARPTGGEVSHGFGLAIAKDLSIALGGNLTCRSVAGQGACFSFSLPAQAAPDSRPSM